VCQQAERLTGIFIMICVSVGRSRWKMVVQEHRALAAKGAELVELRLDWLSNVPDLNRLIENRPTPVVITCRRAEDRGRWRGTEEQRQTLLRSAIVAGVEYVDLEEDIAKSIPRYGSTKRIISFHDFDGTPDNIAEIHQRMAKLDPDIIKIVTMANSPTDMARMLRLVKDSTIPTAGFCMGEIGMPSRVLCGKYGSPLTYATFSESRELAPGQLSFQQMREIYNYDAVTENTRVFGVVGDPIAHSLSPLIHNFAFRAAGVDAVYVPFRIPEGTLAESLQALDPLGIDGYSVTIPHKEAAAKFAEHCDDDVRAIGASNTLTRNEIQQWQAANTDAPAALESILKGLSTPDKLATESDLMGRKVLLLGAGGAARAVGTALVRAGALVTICSRTHKRAIALADEIGCQHVSWENRGAGEPDILVNCTPVGMHPKVDASPYEAHWMHERMLVFDTVYNPETTLLIRHAKERGVRHVSGIEMFVRQAARQFELFIGKPGPIEQMRLTVRRAISPLGDLS
jgi:3-dehydroquinate dehydratase/shikimate dehydrogenase